MLSHKKIYEGKSVDTLGLAYEPTRKIQVHIIGFSITPIGNYLIILIEDGLNLIIFYFIQQLHHSSKLKIFLELF